MKSTFYTILLILVSVQISYSQWTPDTNGIGRTSENAIVVSGNNIFTGTFDRGVYLSTNYGTSWSQTSLNSNYIFSLAVSGNNVFAGTYGNGLFFSTNNGTTWTHSSLASAYVVSLAVSGSYIFAGVYYNGVYVSTDNGTTWTPTSLNNRDVYSLAVSGTNIIAGTALNGVYISTNNGSSWTQTTFNNKTIQSLFVNGNDVYAGMYYSDGVYKSTNNGVTWNRYGLTNRNVYSFALYGNSIIAGSDGYGVFVSSNNDTNWVQRNEGLVGMERVYGLCTLNGYIFAATDYSEYRRVLSEFIGIRQISEQVPGHFSLEQNYPNPFNPTTKIRYNIAHVKQGEQAVKLVIFDVLGNEVATLVNENQKPGTYEAEWSAADFSSGIYYYRVTAGEFSETKKMILLK